MVFRTQHPALPSMTLLITLLVASACSSSGSGDPQSDGSADPSTQETINDTLEDGDNVAPEPEPVAPSTLLNSDNANAVILQAFEVFTGRAYDRRLSAYPYVKQAPRLIPHNNALGGHFYYDTLACDNNGEKTERVYEDNPGFDGFTFYDTTYANCSVKSEVLNGRAVLSGDTCCNHGYQKEFTNDFSVAFGNAGKMNVSGIYTNDGHVSVEKFNYDFTYSGGMLSVSDATTSRTVESMSGTFRMSPPVLANQPVLVTVDEVFENDDYQSTLSYTRGLMRITADDSELIVNANNGDAGTVTVTINAAGESTTLTEPWSNWFQALSFVPPTIGQEIATASANGDGTLINADSYRGILSEVFTVITGRLLGNEILDLPHYPFPEFPYDEVRDIYGFGSERIHTCDNGGTAALRPFRWGSRQETTGWRSEFDNCLKGDVTYDGDFSDRDYGNFVSFSPGITVSEDDSSNTFKGVMENKVRANRGDGAPILYFLLKNVYYDSTSTNNPFVLSEASLNYLYRTNQNSNDLNFALMEGRFAWSSTQTKQNTIKVSIPDGLRFTLSDPDRYTQSDEGVLYIDAGNGNELFLNAATGDVETFAVHLYQPGQETITMTERWLDWR